MRPSAAAAARSFFRHQLPTRPASIALRQRVQARLERLAVSSRVVAGDHASAAKVRAAVGRSAPAAPSTPSPVNAETGIAGRPAMVDRRLEPAEVRLVHHDQRFVVQQRHRLLVERRPNRADRTPRPADPLLPPARRARRTPSLLDPAQLSRSPAVSASTTGSPPSSNATSMTSRVVPGAASTIAASRPASALSRLDLPALGGPIRTTEQALADALAAPAIGQVPRDLACSAATAARAFASSSGRQVLVGEIDRGLEARHRRNQPPRASPRRAARARHPAGAAPGGAAPPSPPRPGRPALRPASGRACRCSKARRVNSPGSAGRSPVAAAQRRQHRRRPPPARHGGAARPRPRR